MLWRAGICTYPVFSCALVIKILDGTVELWSQTRALVKLKKYLFKACQCSDSGESTIFFSFFMPVQADWDIECSVEYHDFQPRISYMRSNSMFQMVCFRHFPTMDILQGQNITEHKSNHGFKLTYTIYFSPTGNINKYLSPCLLFKEKIWKVYVHIQKYIYDSAVLQ